MATPLRSLEALYATELEAETTESTSFNEGSWSMSTGDEDGEGEGVDSGRESEDDDWREDFAGSSPAQTVFNIVKSLVGQGMLSLPAGVAAGTGLPVGVLVAAVFGGLLGYTFRIMGRVCQATGARTHKDCAAVLRRPRLAQTMAVALMIQTSFTCVSFAMVIAESYSRILHFLSLQGWPTSREGVLVMISVGILTPLCLQRDMSALSYTSLFGGLCGVFVASFMQYRLSDGSYFPGGRYYNATALGAHVDFAYPGTPDLSYLYTVSPSTFVLIALVSTAFMGHYNSPKFYVQIRKRSPRRYDCVVAVAFGIAFAIKSWVMTSGYLTFGQHAEGLILNNYAEDDPGATLARLATGFSVLFAFPLSFTALRDSTLSTMGLSLDDRPTFLLATLILLALVVVLAGSLHDLGLLNSLCGAVFGPMTTMIFPGLLLHATLEAEEKGPLPPGMKSRATSPTERVVSVVVVCLGVVLLCVLPSVVVLRQIAPQVISRRT